MNEERALKDVTPSEMTRWLLDSAESDVAEPGAMQRALKGLGLAPVVVAGLASKSALAASSVPVVGASVVTKWIGVGLVTSLSLLGAAELVSRVRHDAAPPNRAPVAAFVPAASASGRELRLEPAPSEETPFGAEPPKVVRSAAKSPLASATVETSLPSAAAFDAAPASTSAAELAALGRARRSLQQGAHADALTQLDEFGQRYPRSGLSEEATVLRVEALLALGRGTEAQTLGASFLAQHPGSVYAARVRTLLNIP